MKKVKSANYSSDGFSIEYYSKDVNITKNDFITNIEEGFSKNKIENIVSIDNARANFNYIKSSGPIHSHNFFEIDIVIAGEIYESNGEKTVVLKKNDAVVLSPMNYHSYTRIDEENEHTIILNIALNEDFLSGGLEQFYILNFPQYFSLSDSEVDLILRILVNTYNCGVEYEDLVIEQLRKKTLSYIIALIFTHLMHNSNNNNLESKSELFSAIIYINANFNKNITCSSVARKCGYSPNYFSSIFKKNTGLTFSEYLLNLRLERARYLLLTKDTAVTEISFSCGFHTVSYFTSLFKKKFKLTPGEYRNKFNKYRSLDELREEQG